MADMISMKRTKADAAGEKMHAVPMDAVYPDYPYGLCLNLERPELAKLGMIEKLPAVGDTMELCVRVKVTRVSQSAVEGADEQTSVSLQVTDVEIED